MGTEDTLLFAPAESSGLGAAIGEAAGLALAPLEARAFEDGEFKLRPLVSVRGRSVFVIQSLAASPAHPTAERLVRLLFLLCALRDGGASRLTAVTPYLAYARKDRRTQPRDPVHTRYLAQLIESTRLDRLVTIDAHNAAALDNAFRIGTDHLSALPMFADHFARQLLGSDFAVASPDIGGVKRAQILCEQLGQHVGHEIELVFLEKRRTAGNVRTGAVVGAVRGRPVLVLDDLCASGGTLRHAGEQLRSAGASAVHVAVTHAPNVEGLRTVLASADITDVTITDTVGTEIHAQLADAGNKLTILPVAPLLGQAIKYQLQGAPMVNLLERWPPQPR